jgi:hypothetical protein
LIDSNFLTILHAYRCPRSRLGSASAASVRCTRHSALTDFPGLGSARPRPRRCSVLGTARLQMSPVSARIGLGRVGAVDSAWRAHRVLLVLGSLARPSLGGVGAVCSARHAHRVLRSRLDRASAASAAVATVVAVKGAVPDHGIATLEVKLVSFNGPSHVHIELIQVVNQGS